MTLEAFLEHALLPTKDVRQGQRLMNTLYNVRQDLYEMISTSSIDCFYDDAKMWSTIMWLHENWCSSNPQRPL